MEKRIKIDPTICNGKPVIAGTRITVQSILEYLAAGDSPEEILTEFPKLSKEDISESLQYAAKLMGSRFSLEAVA